MAKFRKRPVVIEAVQWQPQTKEGIAEMLRFVPMPYLAGDELRIKTLEGTMCAAPGDWVIRGVKGEFYPCKPDIFEETYEAVDG